MDKHLHADDKPVPAGYVERHGGLDNVATARLCRGKGLKVQPGKS